MAERAILVKSRHAGGYDVYHARWGGTDRSLSTVCSGVAPSSLAVNWTHNGHVEQFIDAVTGLDYLGVEVLYREHSRQTAYLSLWLGLPLVTTDCSFEAGTTVEVRSLQDARWLRNRFRTFKCELAAALEGGQLPVPVVPALLLGWVHTLEDRERYVVWRDGSSCDILYAVNRPPGL